MLLTRYVCPHCEAVLKSASGVRPGKKVVCPECDEPFTVSEDEELEERADRRPPTRKKKKKKPSANIGLLLLVLAGVGLLIAVTVGVGVAIVFRKTGPAGLSRASGPAGTADTGPLAQVEMPAGWQEVVSVQGGFRARMPGPVVEQARNLTSPVGPIRDTQYLHEASGESFGYSITFADFSAAQLQKMPLERVIDSGRDAILKLHKGTLEADRRIDRDERPGREIVMRVPGRGRMLLRYYIAGPRLYTLGVTGLRASPDSEDVRAFFDAFRLTGSPER